MSASRSCLYQFLLLLALVVSVPGYAQQVTPTPYAAPAPAHVYTQEQLDQMLAPIALYPDTLLGQILMASTYPLELVEANRWLQQPGNAALQGNQLSAALMQQPWEPSIKSLVPFPNVIKMMDSNLQWMEQLGDAFLANQAGMMDEVQRLRLRAQEAGKLQSMPFQTVSVQAGQVMIQPANPQAVYVPYYSPAVVYGTWPYYNYPPYYFPLFPGYGYYDNGPFAYGVAIIVIEPFWDWFVWDWPHRRFNLDADRFRAINNGRPSVNPVVWNHDPVHRGGVPYRDEPVRAQFQSASDEARRSWRGYTPQVAPASQPSVEHTPSGVTIYRPAREPVVAPVSEQRPVEQRPEQRPVEQEQRPVAPVFESLPRGSETRVDAERGSASRAPMAGGEVHGGGEARDNSNNNSSTHR